MHTITILIVICISSYVLAVIVISALNLIAKIKNKVKNKAKDVFQRLNIKRKVKVSINKPTAVYSTAMNRYYKPTISIAPPVSTQPKIDFSGMRRTNTSPNTKNPLEILLKFGSAERHVSVHGLGKCGGSYYVIGHCHLRDARRTFKVQRIRSYTDLSAGELVTKVKTRILEHNPVVIDLTEEFKAYYEQIDKDMRN